MTAIDPTAKANTLTADSLNLPNAITLSRFGLSLILFGLIDHGQYWLTATGLFVFAASTDWLDGYLARKYGQVTALGRILDPFVDKIIVGGTFLFLLEKNTPEEGQFTSGVTAWMVIAVIGREMFVSSLRGFLEQQGKDFSASFSGKAKMMLQCMAVTAALLSMSPDATWTWLRPTRDLLLWAAVAVTIWSGGIYVNRAIQLLRPAASETQS